jgi:hypothetical protein
MKYFCCDDARRANAVRQSAAVNGVESLEVFDRPDDPPDLRQRVLFVTFLKNLQPGVPGLNNVLIEGGERIRDIRITKVTSGAVGPAPYNRPNVMVVEVAAPGDFSTYTLRLVADAEHARAQGPEVTDSPFRKPPQGFDPVLSAVDFSFKVLCQSDFDCQDDRACATEIAPPPEINYLAKDYATFRQLMLDRMATTAPAWRERNPADPGVALVELLAYVGDRLSYQQDAAATEAYLGTARRRASMRRHARLVDYLVDDGGNARTWVHVRVRDGVSNLLLQSFRPELAEEFIGQPKTFTRFLTRVKDAPGIIPLDSPAYLKALEARPQVFEPLHDLLLDAKHNEMRFYAWGARECCLPAGATGATLRGSFSDLKPGYVLILTEALGPQTGEAADADPTRRHAVRLQKVTLAADPIGGQFDTPATNAPAPLTEIEWHAEDALPFPLCISGRLGTTYFEDMSVALGNIVLADHGLTVEGEALPEAPGSDPALTKVGPHAGGRCQPHTPALTPPRYRPQLRQTPLTQAAAFDVFDTSTSAAAALRREARQFVPAIALTDALLETVWRPRRDLLSSHADAREFVVEVEGDGATTLRFGDDHFGARPAAGARLTADYRVGNGAAGNVGADALVHVAGNDPAIVTDPDNAPVLFVRNPLAARGGRDPETIERIRQDAPEAFRTQERAVTTDDYAEVAATRCGPDVQRAAATLRWTGSWHTVFVTVDRLAGRRVDEEFEKQLRRRLERYRMAGHDLEVDAPRFVSLEVEMVACVKPGYLPSNVKRSLWEKFSSQNLPGGGRGLFHPDNFSFGQPVYLSGLLAAAQAVEGVDSVDITVFQRQGTPSTAALLSGRLELGRLEIARLDNDPDFPERGVFRLTMKGGT